MAKVPVIHGSRRGKNRFGILVGVMALLGAAAYYASSGSRGGVQPALWFATRLSALPVPAALTKLMSGGGEAVDTHVFNPILLSEYPLIIYLENFLSLEEAAHLKDLAQGKLKRSTVGKENREAEYRTSSTAFLPRNDSIVRRVLLRSARFQGYVATERIEELQVTSYTTGQQYREHWDTLGPGPRARAGETEEEWRAAESQAREVGQRESTIFAVLEADCGDDRRCGTRFPLLAVDWAGEDSRWCELVDCDAAALTIRARPGNAVYWRNLDRDGRTEELTLHAGLPVPDGTKVGLNIWTKEKPWSKAVVDDWNVRSYGAVRAERTAERQK